MKGPAPDLEGKDQGAAVVNLCVRKHVPVQVAMQRPHPTQQLAPIAGVGNVDAAAEVVGRNCNLPHTAASVAWQSTAEKLTRHSSVAWVGLVGGSGS